jgi:sugar lactone lactonase YvrE
MANHPVTRAHRLVEGTRLGEGPVWSAAWGELRWVDILAGDVLRLSGDTIDRWHVGHRVGAIRPRASGGVAIALERGFGLADGWGSPVEVLPELWTDPALRFNDGNCDPDGRFWCGSMRYDEVAGDGVMYRLAPDRSVTRELTGLGLSNGLDWTPDGGTAYYADTLTGRVDRFGYDRDRGLHDRREFVRIPDGAGKPDGLVVDADGAVWVALWGGAAVHRYAPDGGLETVIEIDDAEATSMAFGGADLDQLFITSKQGLFHAEPGVRGQPVRVFGG